MPGQRIVLVGYLGAGKTIATQYLQGRHGFTAVISQDPLKELLHNPNPSREELIKVGREVNENRMRFPHGVVGLTLDYVARTVTADRMVVDCMRFPQDVEHFQYHGWAVAGIECPSVDVRIQRVIDRNDPKDRLTGNLEQDRTHLGRKMEEERTIFKVDTSLQMADYTILNEKSLSEFHVILSEIVQLNRRIEYLLGS